MLVRDPQDLLSLTLAIRCCTSAFYSFEIITNVSYLTLVVSTIASLWCGFGLLDIMAIYCWNTIFRVYTNSRFND